MARIAIVGTGYVGLTTGACMAEMGHTVCCLDINRRRVEDLRAGVIPIYEPGMDTLVATNVAAGRLRFSADYRDALSNVEFVVIAVPTPMSDDGQADLRYVVTASKQIARSLTAPAIVINKSTSPVGTADRISGILEAARPEFGPWSVVCNPEFLREGCAIDDCLHPARVVLGSRDMVAAHAVEALYESLDCPAIITDPYTAEMIKYGSNAFLAMRISFVNEVARICDALGADVTTVAKGMGLDPRIGSAFLQAGLGYGGSCFPKDVSALAGMAVSAGLDPQLLQSTRAINDGQRDWAVKRLEETLGHLEGATVAVLGLAFKPDTDDLREAPALDIIQSLIDRGASVRAYDPVAMPGAERLGVPALLCGSIEECVSGVDAVLLATDWDVFIHADWARIGQLMRGTVVFDGRNCLDPQVIARHGMNYLGVGRPGLVERTSQREARERIAAVA